MELKNILVALDLSHLDDTLIKYTTSLCKTLKVGKVYFVHNIKKYEISELFKEELKEVNLDDIIGDELNEKVEQHFDADCDWEVLISEDPYTESLMSYIANKYKIDLTILGNKLSSHGSGVVTGKLLRLLKCDILSIPAVAKAKISNIWVGSDFSKSSAKAWKVGSDLAENTSAKLNLVNIFSVPVQFTPYLPKEKMAPKIEKHTREKAEKFLDKQPSKDQADIKIIAGRDNNEADKLLEEARKNKADLIIVSDKGNNTFSTLLVGSVTEELFNLELPMPLWIAK